MDLVDAGMSGMYAADCAALARVAASVGRRDWASELQSRAAAVAAALDATLWDPVTGLWLNRYINATAPPANRFLASNPTKAPPNFYPLWTGVPSKEQVRTRVWAWCCSWRQLEAEAHTWGTSLAGRGGCCSAPSQRVRVLRERECSFVWNLRASAEHAFRVSR